MDLTLSWDLVIIVFFAIVMSYSFIIGKDQSVKVMIAAYISIIATQGIGNAIFRYQGEAEKVLKIMDVTFNVSALAAAKIFLFAFFIILFAIRSGIHVVYAKDRGTLIGGIYTALFGFSTAGLIISTILTFVSGRGILEAGTLLVAEGAHTSKLMTLMTVHQDLWFALPALLIISAGFINNE